jgi:serine/threonine protein phosphatase PrpC
MSQELEFQIGAKTDVGMRRSNNEDCFALVPQINLCVLSDGMGGQNAGELASKMTVDTISGVMREAAAGGQKVLYGNGNPQVSDQSNQLGSAVRLANRAVWETGKKHTHTEGMGATVVTAWLHSPIMNIAHVGDSRIYLLRGGEMQQITQDHSLVMEQVRRGLLTREEAEKSDMANIIVRAMGAEENVNVDVDDVLLMPGDHVVLCSDGLTKMMDDAGIAQIVEEAPTPQQAADRLVEAANDAGGEDNVTVIVVRVVESKPKGFWALLKSLFID